MKTTREIIDWYQKGIMPQSCRMQEKVRSAKWYSESEILELRKKIFELKEIKCSEDFKKGYRRCYNDILMLIDEMIKDD